MCEREKYHTLKIVPKSSPTCFIHKGRRNFWQRRRNLMEEGIQALSKEPRHFMSNTRVRNIQVRNKGSFFPQVRRFLSCDIPLTEGQQKLLIDLGDRNVSPSCDHKTFVKITKIQNACRNLKLAKEEIDVYKQLLREGGDLGDGRNEGDHGDEDMKELSCNLASAQTILTQEILDFYKTHVNVDHHLDVHEATLEILPGVGGQEAKLFCRELLGMYENYCRVRGYECEVKCRGGEDTKGSGKGIVAHVRGENVYEDFIQEIGIHRVQRIPVNCNKMQTSTSIVLVFNKKKMTDRIEKKINISKCDLILETKRSGGAGGQSVNKNETCVKVIHKPTNVCVEVQKTSSQIQNKSIAIEMLKNKLYSLYYDKEKEQMMKKRKDQMQSGDRSEKIRTYNFTHNTVTDHIANVQYSDIDQFFKGDKLVCLINTRKVLFYHRIIDETLTDILSRTT
ncbi:peptide release factor, putative [Plasmodium ovale curtisi]|uniref:Peptide release factor, putative n=1 Tax=Plasmodium ovale curtisi TaxID=864141 RepID=A0A1A8VU66_PLAOA|nr:peptide release factor, putative [Plasmodium ovale curtisi]